MKKRIAGSTSLLKAPYNFNDIIGLETVKHKAEKLAQKEVNILLIGESGTGKELFASSIHNASKRSRKPYVVVNCAAIPESLFESELFGYRKGAFTDARHDHTGRIEFASKGTLFLDEIGDMPLGVQSKLLRVIEDKTVTRLGGNMHRSVDVRFIFATNQDLSLLVNEQRFRNDLFYRISAPCVKIPPLRKRKHELPALVQTYIKDHKYDHGTQAIVSEKAMTKLMRYHFPGNVRELYGILKSALFINGDGIIGEKDIDIPHNGSLKNLRKQLADYAVQIIKDQLLINKNNVKLTAKQLEISTRTLYRYLRRKAH